MLTWLPGFPSQAVWGPGTLGSGSWCVIRNDERAWSVWPQGAQGAPDLCGSEKFHELDLIVSLGVHPSLTPKLPLPVPYGWGFRMQTFLQHSLSLTHTNLGPEIFTQPYPHVNSCALTPPSIFPISSPFAKFNPSEPGPAVPRVCLIRAPLPPPTRLTTPVPLPVKILDKPNHKPDDKRPATRAAHAKLPPGSFS